MKAVERDILIHAIYQGMYGVSGTEEKGMIGDIKDIREDQGEQKGKVLLNTIYRRIIVSVGSLGIVTLVLHMLGVY